MPQSWYVIFLYCVANCTPFKHTNSPKREKQPGQAWATSQVVLQRQCKYTAVIISTIMRERLSWITLNTSRHRQTGLGKSARVLYLDNNAFWSIKRLTPAPLLVVVTVSCNIVDRHITYCTIGRESLSFHVYFLFDFVSFTLSLCM